MRRPKEPREPGLTDRSERPTTHARLAPTERRKAAEERRFKAVARAEGRTRGRTRGM